MHLRLSEYVDNGLFYTKFKQRKGLRTWWRNFQGYCWRNSMWKFQGPMKDKKEVEFPGLSKKEIKNKNQGISMDLGISKRYNNILQGWSFVLSGIFMGKFTNLKTPQIFSKHMCSALCQGCAQSELLVYWYGGGGGAKTTLSPPKKIIIIK